MNLRVIFAVMNTTLAVVKRRPEKNSGLYGICIRNLNFLQAFFSILLIITVCM